MKWLACFLAAAAMAWAQSGGALLSNQEALKLEQRTVQLMESTGLAVPGLSRAGAPALEDARQTLANLETAPQNAGNTLTLLGDARAYLAISDTVPKPFPFPNDHVCSSDLDARQTLANLETAPQNAGNTLTLLGDARAYLAISDTVPKPFPFPEEGRRQFGELRDAVDRLDSHQDR